MADSAAQPRIRRPRPLWATVGMIIAAVAAVAVLSVGGYILLGQPVWTDGDALRIRSADARIRNVLWSTPTPIAESLRSDTHQYEPALSPVGDELYFVRGTPGENADLYLTRRTAQGWSDPQPVTDINSPADELGPRLSADGQWLFFYSDRVGGHGMYDIWAARRDGQGWSEPFCLPEPINSPFNDYSPSLSPDGKRLVFATDRTAAAKLKQTQVWRATIRSVGIDDFDLWTAELPDDLAALAGDDAVVATAAPLEGLNTPYREGACDISPDGRFIYFTSNRPSGLGGLDLYRARLHDDRAVDVENLGAEVNSDANETDPHLSLAGFRLYFSSDRVSPDAGADEPHYDLFTAVSREVFAERDRGSLPSLGMTWWVLVGALLLALLLFWRAADISTSRMSLLARCVLVSLLLHLLLTIVFSVLLLSQQVMEYAREQAGMQIAVNPEVDPELTVQAEVREQLTDLPTPEPRVTEAQPQQTLPQIDVDAFMPRPAQLNTPRAQVQPMTVTIAPRQPDKAQPQPEPSEPMMPELSAATPSPRVRLQQSQPIARQEPAPQVTMEQPQPERRQSAAIDSPQVQLESVAMRAEPLSANDLVSQVVVRVHERRAEAQQTQPEPSTAPTPIRPQLSQRPLENAAPVRTAEAAPTDDTARAVASQVKQEATSPEASPTRTAMPIPTTEVTPDALRVQTAVQRKDTVNHEPLVMDRPMPTQSVVAQLPTMAAKTATEDPTVTAVTAPPQPTERQPLGVQDVASRPNRDSLAFAGPPTTDRTPSTVTDAPIGPPLPRARLASAESDQPAPDLSLPVMHLGPLKVTSPPSLRQRRFEQRQKLLREMGGTKESEDAVARALVFLKKSQQPDGRWTKFDDDYSRGGSDKHDPAITALATLAFLASDHTPGRSAEYGQTVSKALDYLLKIQKDNGDLRGSGDMYDQGIATLAVAEAAILTNDPRYRDAAIRAAQFIVKAQHKESGGWRYTPNQAGDTSVLGWQVMAMHSVEMLGWTMPEETREGAIRWLDHVASGKHKILAGYQHRNSPTAVMTAEAVFSRIMLNQKPTEEQLREAGEFVLKHPPNKAGRDYYYFYYGTLMQMQLQGPTWTKWNSLQRDYLISLQTKGGRNDGSWDPNSKWASRAGRAYSTAMSAMTLQAYYRYLPMLKEDADE